MKWIPKQILFLAAVFFAATSFGQNGDFLFKRKLQNIPAQWNKISLPDDIFSNINADFSDLRILGITQKNDTIEIPYLLNNPSRQEILKEIPFRLVNESSNGNVYYFTFDANETEFLNEINLSFKESNFDWKVKLEGSQNQQDWFSIVDDYRIVSIKNVLTDFQFTKLVFPESNYKYFRISIKNSQKPVLQSATLVRKKIADGTTKNYTIISKKIEENKKLKQTIILVSLKEKVPVSSVKLMVNAGIDYYRPITIFYLSDSSKTGNGWRYNYQNLNTGILASSTPNIFNFGATIAKDFQIVIENRDNQPVIIDSLKVMGYQYEMTARFTEPAEYFLFYGNKFAANADYDIGRFLEKIPVELNSITPGKEEVIQKKHAEKPSSLFENENYMWLIIVIIIAVLGFFSISMMKRKK